MHLELITQTPTGPMRPTPVLFVHGMFHAAWCWAEHFLPFFAEHGYAAHALSLRGPPLASYIADVAQAVEQMEHTTRAEFFPVMGHALMLDTGWQAVAQRILDWLDHQTVGPKSAQSA